MGKTLKLEIEFTKHDQGTPYSVKCERFGCGGGDYNIASIMRTLSIFVQGYLDAADDLAPSDEESGR